MRTLHIANTYFEFELSGELKGDLGKSLRSTPLSEQLQFLPLLYCAPEDTIVATEVPAGVPNAQALDAIHGPYDQVDVWGWCPSVTDWLNSQGIYYCAPLWDAVKRVNSKEFTATHASHLPTSALIRTPADLRHWQGEVQYPAVLKKVYGVAGHGHRIIQAPDPQAESFCAREWKQGRPVLGEPWVERSLDFSTQWHLRQQGEAELIGVTVIENSSRGSYRKTFVGVQSPRHLDAHLAEARRILALMQAEGYFGAVGIDAFEYAKGEKLYPVVEVNARQTMSLVALRFQRTHHSGRSLSLEYSPIVSTVGTQGLLPQGRSGRQLTYELLTS